MSTAAAATAAIMVSSAAVSGDMYADTPSTEAPVHLTTESRMARAGMPLDERRALRDSMARRANEGPEEGLAKRRSVELYAEIRRVLGPDAPLRT